MTEAIYVPGPEDHDPEGASLMTMGRGAENDLRDPWFHTEEGQAWLTRRDTQAR